MTSHTYLSVNDALPSLARHVLNGDELGSRKGERVLEQTHQQITLLEPWDRYNRLPLRKAALPAQIAETMWVLSGRNDVDWLSYYLPRATEFSDDGTTWRGGYGPRLRSFGPEGLDQLAHVVDVLSADPTSRRAVMSIYDPTVDMQPGQDIPCNDFITFQSRLGELHMHVFVRSNDLMWGWSGINAFEWSVLQEIVAGMLGVGPGKLTFSISSLHAYDRHWSKLGKIADAYPDADLYASAGRGKTLSEDPYRPRTVDELDSQLIEWMDTERLVRGAASLDEALVMIDGGNYAGVFAEWLRVIAASRFRDPSVVSDPDMRAALKTAPVAPYAVPETEDTSPAPGMDRAWNDFIQSVVELHDAKHAAYGTSWKRRGESLGILANIARKTDRLGKTDDTETALDTAVDLLVYLAKYEAWLVDQIKGSNYSDETTGINDQLVWFLSAAGTAQAPPDPRGEALAWALNHNLLNPVYTQKTITEDRLKEVRWVLPSAARHVYETWAAREAA